jgi:hypothetical protein
MKVSELTGSELDYWTAKAQEWVIDDFNDGFGLIWVTLCNRIAKRQSRKCNYTPSTNWQQCGELIRKFDRIEIITNDECNPPNLVSVDRRNYYQGSTPQEAICRAVVAGVFGDEVPLPQQETIKQESRDE